MKKNKKIVLITIVAIIAIIMSFIGGQVYAKYMSKITGSGTADIASWSFKVNEKDEKMQTISLNSTINNNTLVNNKIAPGTEGNFQIKIDATGAEVGIDYKIIFENEKNKPTNLIFEYENQKYNSIAELQKDLIGTINADEKEKIKTLNINWKWPYETGKNQNEINQNDVIDTNEAKNIGNYTFDVIITGTQVMPNT